MGTKGQPRTGADGPEWRKQDYCEASIAQMGQGRASTQLRSHKLGCLQDLDRMPLSLGKGKLLPFDH